MTGFSVNLQGQDLTNAGQIQVDIIYRCGVCGLMNLCNREVWQAEGISDVGVLAKVLRN